MSLLPKITLLLLILSMAPLFLNALPENEAKAGRDVMKRFADSVVGVEMVVTVKVNVGDRAMPPRENKVEVNGTVLNASGLTVTSLAAIDPRTQFEAMRGAMGANGQHMEVSDTDYKEVKLRLADGSEVPAKVVLKDGDLDLAFIAPDAEAGGTKRIFSPVNLDDAIEGVQLNTYVSVSRAPKGLQRVPLVRLPLINGIVEKPRRLYLLSEQQLGCPVFDQQGHVLGISVQNLNGGRSNGLVVIPAADVAEIAKQAATAKPIEAPKAAPATAPESGAAPEKKS